MLQLKKRIEKLEDVMIPDNSVYELDINPESSKWYKVEDGKKIELPHPPIIKGIPIIEVRLVD
jgi:hypothetical protein